MRIFISMFALCAFWACKNDSPATNNPNGETTENAVNKGDRSQGAVAPTTLVENAPTTSISTDTVVKILTPIQFYQLSVQHPNYPIYDLRSEKEYKAAHIWRSIHMDGSDPQFVEKMLKLGTENPIMIYCGTGSLSFRLAEQLRVYGHKKVYMIRDGIINWSATGQAFQTSMN